MFPPLRGRVKRATKSGAGQRIYLKKLAHIRQPSVETFRITSLGQTGLVRNDAVATTYRLRATGDLVTVAPLPLNEMLPYSSPLVTDPPLRVRGRAAEATYTINGTSAIRWIENDTVFEMSSRTLTVAQLAELADRLR